MGDAGEKFIKRWNDSGDSEQANSQVFLSEPCALLKMDVFQPTRHPDEHSVPAYAFERQVVLHNGDGTPSTGRFVLESKRGILGKEPLSTPTQLAANRAPRHQGLVVEDTPGCEEAMLQATGLIGWLRPEYQAPTKQAPVQDELAGMAAPTPAAHASAEKQPWPTALAAQAQAVRQALEALAVPADVATVAKCFSRAPRARVAELLETLVGLGQARVLEAGRYAGRL